MESLPAEIVYKIFNFLLLKDIVKFSTLNKQLNRITKNYSNSDSVNHLFNIYHITNVEKLLKKNKLISQYWPHLLFRVEIRNSSNNHHLLEKIKFDNIKALEFQSYRAADISLFKNIPNLDLSYCKWISSLEPLRGNNISDLYLDSINFDGLDLTPIANIKYLSFCYSNIRDLSGLENSTNSTILLRSCHYIVDLKPLRNVKSIYLEGCSGVSDISPLKKIPKIHLVEMYNVRDISPLKDANELCINVCRNIENNLSILKGVKKLTLINCHLKGIEELEDSARIIN